MVNAPVSYTHLAIDISACRDNLNMLIKVMGDIDKSADTSKWLIVYSSICFPKKAAAE